MGLENGGESTVIILVIIYMVAGYWSTGKTIYANKILIGTGSSIFLQRVTMGTILGWILIPIAILKVVFGK